MSEPVESEIAGLLAQIVERLDALEGRTGHPSSAPVLTLVPEDEWGDWNEDPDSATSKAAGVDTPAPSPRSGPAFPRPKDIAPPEQLKHAGYSTARTSGVLEGVGVTSDSPIQEGRGTGYMPSDEQFYRMQQREMFAPMRVRPLEDGPPGR